MAAKKFLRLVGGIVSEVLGVQVSGGAANAGDIPALNDQGRLDMSVMPVGMGADTAQIEASEALSAGDFVNVWDDGGTAKVRKADASMGGKDAHGFVLAAVASGSSATVYFEGTNDQVTGQVPGLAFLQTTAGKSGQTVPSGAGQVVQQVGVAVSATAVNFERGMPVVLA